MVTQKEAIVTDHANKRAKKRLGVGKKSAQKVSDRALEVGITHVEVKGQLKKFVDGLYLREKKANNILIHNQKVYLFNGKVLITILNLPQRYHKTAKAILTKREQVTENR